MRYYHERTGKPVSPAAASRYNACQLCNRKGDKGISSAAWNTDNPDKTGRLRALLTLAISGKPSRSELVRLLGDHTPEELASLLEEPEALKESIATCTRLGINAVCFASDEYPPLLRTIPDPPAILFYSGSLASLCKSRTVAVIGSRRCSVYGRSSARKISSALSSAGVCVVSGLARGIDGEAHRGALEGGGHTAAVFASGPDVVYPPEHRKLAMRIKEKGCLISEYPPGIKPAKYTFPERNRIISGLSSAVVVVEAGERSGTMITVGTALDQGRDVYAVPGEIGRSTSTGTNRLLRDGAGIVLSPEELLSEMGIDPVQAGNSTHDPLIQAMGRRGKTPAQLVEITGISTTEIQMKLFQLEMAGAVVRRPGNIFLPL